MKFKMGDILLYKGTGTEEKTGKIHVVSDFVDKTNTSFYVDPPVGGYDGRWSTVHFIKLRLNSLTKILYKKELT